MSLLWFILIGIAAGWLAGQLMKGGGFGLVGDLVVGVIGALLGGCGDGSRTAGGRKHPPQTEHYPANPGIDQVHAAGKRVIVIGNGASAMQICPEIQHQVGSLTIFQRGPHWAAPNPQFIAAACFHPAVNSGIAAPVCPERKSVEFTGEILKVFTMSWLLCCA